MKTIVLINTILLAAILAIIVMDKFTPPQAWSYSNMEFTSFAKSDRYQYPYSRMKKAGDIGWEMVCVIHDGVAPDIILKKRGSGYELPWELAHEHREN